MAGPLYGFPPHVGDAMTLLKDSWESISSSTVAACWAHSHCLSSVTTTELQSESHDYTKEVESKSIDEMCSKLDITDGRGSQLHRFAVPQAQIVKGSEHHIATPVDS